MLSVSKSSPSVLSHHRCARSATAQENDCRAIVTHSHNISSQHVTEHEHYTSTVRNTITEDKVTNTFASRGDYSRRTDLTHMVGALLPMPPCLGIGGHTGASRQGHPRYTNAHIVRRPWVAHNKLHATPPTRQNQGYRDTLWLPTW